MSDYESRRQYGDSFLDDVKAILANGFKIDAAKIKIAGVYDDTQRATDLILPNGTTVAVRIRQPQYRRYLGQFTLRTSGAYPELQKVKDGLVHFIFYAFEAVAGGLSEWFLMKNGEHLLTNPIEDKTNGNDSHFRAFKINPESVVGCWRGVPDDIKAPTGR
jgi:hypothetical protein